MHKKNDGHGFPNRVCKLVDITANFQKGVEKLTLTCSNMLLASIGKPSLQ